MKSIATRFNFLTVFLILLAALATGGFAIWQYQANTFRNFVQHGEEIATLLAKNIAYGVYTENEETIALSLQGLKEIPDIAYLVVINKQKKILTKLNYQNLLRIPQMAEDSLIPSLGDTTVNSSFDADNNKSYLDIRVPVFIENERDSKIETIGYVQLGISQDRINLDTTTFTLDVLLLAGVTVFLGMMLIFWHTRRITLPIKILAFTAKAVSKGELSKVPQIQSNDEIAELAVSINKISEDLKKYQQDASFLRESLEEQDQKRAEELQQKTDEASQLSKKAEAANITNTQFLETISNEIRNPINGVLGMNDLLLSTELNARQTRMVETAFRSAESLLTIINNIQVFSKLETGKLTLSVNNFDLRKMLEDTIRLLNEQAHHKGLELILNISHELNSMVRGDSDRLRQILVNLLGNAIKSTVQGEVQLKVNVLNQARMDKTTQLHFEISDSGPGIAFDQQRNISEDLLQQETGLALTISRQLVERMGGELNFHCIPGKGCLYFFDISLELSPGSNVQPAKIEALKGLKTLLVADNETNREILSEQLNLWGVHCTSVVNTTKVVDLLRDAASQNSPYRIALLDWQSPEMDDIDLAHLIQKETQNTPLSVVILSSDSVSVDPEEMKRIGINRILNKPVFHKQLLECLLEILGTFNDIKKIPRQDIDNTLLDGQILLAEDNPVNQEVALAMLNKIGCQVDVVDNGQKAVSAFAEKAYDLILMDYHMPEMDGLQATMRIRNYEQSAGQHGIPIVALTADVETGTQQKCLEAGMNNYLSKPFNRKQLHEILEIWLPNQVIDSSDSKQLPLHSAETETVDGMLNLEALEELRGLPTSTGEPLLDKAIKLYLENTPEDINNMRLAFNNGNVGDLAKIAHTLKSGSASLGAQFLADSCSALESIANKGNVNGVKKLLDEIDQNFLAVQKALQNQLSSSIVKKEIDTVNNFFQKRLLIVDDDPNFLLITGEMLRSKGFLIDEVNSGVEALKKVENYFPDIIILDAVMDGMDGFETCRELRALPSMMDIPIIMSTGLYDIQSINLAFEAGASDFIIKPLNYTVLIHHIQFLLRASQATAELRTSKLQLAAAQCIARLGYWSWDVESNTFTLSAHLAVLCRIDADGFAGSLESYLALVHPEDRHFVKEAIESTLEEEASSHIEFRLNVSGSEQVIVQQETAVGSNNSGIQITGTVQDITKQKENEKLIYQLAYMDELTGLASRSYYQKRIENIIRNSKRRNEKFAFLFLDLDGFKDINDSFGHNIGDQFLKAIAERVKNIVRDVDFAARLGGDEFCIIVGNISEQYYAAEVAERCLTEINRKLTLGSHEIRPRVSIGIAIYPKDGDNEHDLMKAADAAMYSAKQAGKQCYAYYTPEMTQMAKHRLQEEQMLRDAVEQKQFILHYQPQISMLSGRIVGVEALIRWQHPERGLLSPIEFISLAESIGLIVDIGNWVLETACKQIVEWQQMGFPQLQLAVNISPIHFREVTLYDHVCKVLEKTGLAAELLELEVTESVLQTDGSLDIFSQLRKLGVKIALDDFGTGFSSLASLKQLPIDCLKVDKIFINDLENSTQTSLLLGTIIGLGKALNYILVAEGVETIEQALIMSGLGCEIIQGYYFSVPIPAEDIPSIINTDFTLENNNHRLAH